MQLPNLCSSLSRFVHHPDLHSFPTRRSSDLHDRREHLEPEPKEHRDHSAHDEQDQLGPVLQMDEIVDEPEDRKSTRLNSSHTVISYAVFCLKKKRREVSEYYTVAPAR